VRCRVRSEIQARKTAEAAAKKGMKQAFVLRKEVERLSRELSIKNSYDAEGSREYDLRLTRMKKSLEESQSKNGQMQMQLEKVTAELQNTKKLHDCLVAEKEQQLAQHAREKELILQESEGKIKDVMQVKYSADLAKRDAQRKLREIKDTVKTATDAEKANALKASRLEEMQKVHLQQYQHLKVKVDRLRQEKTMLQDLASKQRGDLERATSVQKGMEGIISALQTEVLRLREALAKDMDKPESCESSIEQHPLALSLREAATVDVADVADAAAAAAAAAAAPAVTSGALSTPKMGVNCLKGANSDLQVKTRPILNANDKWSIEVQKLKVQLEQHEKLMKEAQHSAESERRRRESLQVGLEDAELANAELDAAMRRALSSEQQANGKVRDVQMQLNKLESALKQRGIEVAFLLNPPTLPVSETLKQKTRFHHSKTTKMPSHGKSTPKLSKHSNAQAVKKQIKPSTSPQVLGQVSTAARPKMLQEPAKMQTVSKCDVGAAQLRNCIEDQMQVSMPVVSPYVLPPAPPAKEICLVPRKVKGSASKKQEE